MIYYSPPLCVSNLRSADWQRGSVGGDLSRPQPPQVALHRGARQVNTGRRPARSGARPAAERRSFGRLVHLSRPASGSPGDGVTESQWLRQHPLWPVITPLVPLPFPPVTSAAPVVDY